MNVLDGIRVIDLSTAYSAPIATMQLADFGADVIKIENVTSGDSSRMWKTLPVSLIWKRSAPHTA